MALSEAQAVQCRFCSGMGYTGPVHVNRGNGHGEWIDRIECTHCGTTGNRAIEGLRNGKNSRKTSRKTSALG